MSHRLSIVRRVVAAVSLVPLLAAADPQSGLERLVAEVRAVEDDLEADATSPDRRVEIDEILGRVLAEDACTAFLHTEVALRLGRNAVALDRRDVAEGYFRDCLAAARGRFNLATLQAHLRLAALRRDPRGRTVGYIALAYRLRGELVRVVERADAVLGAEGGELALYGEVYRAAVDAALYRRQVADAVLNAIHGLELDLEGAVAKAEKTGDDRDRALADLIGKSGILTDDVDREWWLERLED